MDDKNSASYDPRANSYGNSNEKNFGNSIKVSGQELRKDQEEDEHPYSHSANKSKGNRDPNPPSYINDWGI